jgi:hypothetical protein
MRIFVLGAGGTGSLLAHLLKRQGHTVWCGDRDPERGRRFLGKNSGIDVVETNARNLWAIVRSGRGANLVINASPPVYNEIILRAALRLRAHYLDLNAHLTRSPFKPEQYRFHKRFVAKNRAALICTGVAPGLTNLLAKRGAELLESVDSIHIRLLESTESKDPVSTWSPEAAYDEAISRPRVYRDGKFALAKRFDGREKFRFPAPIGEIPVYLAAQDEVCMLPYEIGVREVDAKIGGNDFERMRRLYRQGRLNRSQGMVRKRFPKTLTPKGVCFGVGARDERRSAAAGALGREFSYVVSNSQTRVDCDSDRLRHGAYGGAVRETFSARFGGRDGAGGVACGCPARDFGGGAFAGFSDCVEDHAFEEKRRRRFLGIAQLADNLRRVKVAPI